MSATTPYQFNPFGQPRPGVPSNAQSFVGFIQEGKIFQSTVEGPQPIGVTAKTYDDLKAQYDDIYGRCQEYYDALVDHGVIVPEPTQEEIIQQQAEQLRRATEMNERNLMIQEQMLLKQEEMAAKQAELAARFEELITKGGTGNEHAGIDHQEHPRPVPQVEKPNGRGLENNQRLQKLPVRPDAGDPGKKPEAQRPAKGTTTPAKRTGGKHP